jgi:hypothetical protein
MYMDSDFFKNNFQKFQKLTKQTEKTEKRKRANMIF